MEEQLERKVIELIAFDRIDIPISSLSGKLKRSKPKLAAALDLREDFDSERAYARKTTQNEQKARGTKEGIEMFCNKFPQYGKILHGYIEEKRAVSETHVYFGMQQGKRLTESDYHGVLTTLGFSDGMASQMYPVLIEASRRIARARDDEERSVMIGNN